MKSLYNIKNIVSTLKLKSEENNNLLTPHSSLITHNSLIKFSQGLDIEDNLMYNFKAILRGGRIQPRVRSRLQY